jgi:hypothetical protein
MGYKNTEYDDLDIDQPAPPAGGRASRFFLFVFLAVPFVACMLAVFRQTPLAPSPLTTPAVSDFVANQDERLELENQRAAIDLELTRMANEIAQADQQQKNALLREQMSLENERIALTNDIERWQAVAQATAQAREVENNALATQTALLATSTAVALAGEQNQLALEKERATANLVATFSPLAQIVIGLVALIAVGLVGWVAVCFGIVAWTMTAVHMANYKALQKPTITLSPPPARPVTNALNAPIPHSSAQFGINSTREEQIFSPGSAEFIPHSSEPIPTPAGAYELFDGREVKLPWSIATEPDEWQQKYMLHLWHTNICRSVTAIASHCYKADGKRASKKQEAWVRGVLANAGIEINLSEVTHELV